MPNNTIDDSACADVGPNQPTEDVLAQCQSRRRTQGDENRWSPSGLDWWSRTNQANLETLAEEACSDCPLLKQCRAWAIDCAPTTGIYAGMTPLQRLTEKVLNENKPLHGIPFEELVSA